MLNIKNKLVLLSLVNAYQQVPAYRILLEDMQPKWDNFKNQATGEHLIKDGAGTVKTDACVGYASELMMKLRNSPALNLSSWCTLSMTKLSTDKNGGLNGIGLGVYRSNEDLFKWILTKVMLVDPLLVEAIIDKENQDKHILTYVLSKHGEFPEGAIVDVDYFELLARLQEVEVVEINNHKVEVDVPVVDAIMGWLNS